MAAAAENAPEPPARIGGAGLLAAGAMGAVVALALGLYGRAHDPQTDLAITLGFSDTITMKVWLSSVAFILFALFQIFSALWLYGRLPIASRPPVPIATRPPDLRAARVPDQPARRLPLPLPAGVPGHDDARARPLAARLPLSTVRSPPRSTLDPHAGGGGRGGCPLIGGTVFTLLVATWVTSGLWFITTSGIPSP